MKGGIDDPFPLSIAEYKSRSAAVTDPASIPPLKLTSARQINFDLNSQILSCVITSFKLFQCITKFRDSFETLNGCIHVACVAQVS
jgi:hypothetical protein